MEVASHGENTSYEVPCLIVAAKDDLDPYPMAIHDSTRVFTFFSSVIISFALCYSWGCQFGEGIDYTGHRIKSFVLQILVLQLTQDMGIEPPIPISAKLGDFNTIFRRIIAAAEHPHLSIPETEAGRSRKQYSRLINRSLMVVSGTSMSEN